MSQRPPSADRWLNIKYRVFEPATTYASSSLSIEDSGCRPACPQSRTQNPVFKGWDSTS